MEFPLGFADLHFLPVVIALSVLTAEWGMLKDFGGKTRRVLRRQ